MKTDDWRPTVRCVYLRVASHLMECDRLVSGSSQKTVALGLCYLLLVVDSVSRVVGFKLTFLQFVVFRTLIVTFYLNLFRLTYKIMDDSL
jgi:hypothetical protein